MPRKKGSKNKKKLEYAEGFEAERVIGKLETPVTLYKVTLKSVGRVYKSEGATLEEAIGKIKVMGGVKAMAVLTVEKGDKSKERIINGNLAQKLFGAVGPTMKEIAFKQISQLIGL